MNRYTHNRMRRRTFLQAVGSMAGVLVLGRRVWAERLVLVAVGSTTPISQVEWVLYDTGLQDSNSQPLRRCALRLTTTAGVQGWADFEARTAPDDQTARLIKDILLGRDLADHESIWQQLYEQGIPLDTLSAVDIALWDLRGRTEGQPVHALLGTKRQKIGSYVSTGFYLSGPSEYAAFATTCKERGAQGVKVEADAGSSAQDIAIYSAVREAVGPDFMCIASGAAAYTSEQALQVGLRLDELGYAWYQSPMPENDAWIGSYATLVGEIETPVVAPESDPGSYQSRITWIERAACDIPCIDAHHGGLTACVQLARACEARGIRVALNNVGPDAYAHLQLAGAADESLLTHIELLSLSPEPSTLPGRTTPEPVFDEQGCVAIPQAPGMGLELDWKYIFTHRIG